MSIASLTHCRRPQSFCRGCLSACCFLSSLADAMSPHLPIWIICGTTSPCTLPWWQATSWGVQGSRPCLKVRSHLCCWSLQRSAWSSSIFWWRWTNECATSNSVSEMMAMGTKLSEQMMVHACARRNVNRRPCDLNCYCSMMVVSGCARGPAGKGVLICHFSLWLGEKRASEILCLPALGDLQFQSYRCMPHIVCHSTTAELGHILVS